MDVRCFALSLCCLGRYLRLIDVIASFVVLLGSLCLVGCRCFHAVLGRLPLFSRRAVVQDTELHSIMLEHLKAVEAVLAE